MKLVGGAIFLLTAEQAFAHAHLVGFPHHEHVNDVLVPVSAALACLGVLFVFWGTIAEVYAGTVSQKKSDR